MKFACIISFFVSILGALLWLFVGLFGFNPLTQILGYKSIICNFAYIFIGVCGLFNVYALFAFKMLAYLK